MVNKENDNLEFGVDGISLSLLGSCMLCNTRSHIKVLDWPRYNVDSYTLLCGLLCIL